MALKELTDGERATLSRDTLDLIGALQDYHDKWCDNPVEGSRYIGCYRIMKMVSQLTELLEELGPFPQGRIRRR